MKSQSTKWLRRSSADSLARRSSCHRKISSGQYLYVVSYSQVTPSDFHSHHGHSGVKCSIKANEGLLYFLDKSLIFVPKPATYVQIENIAVITMSRVGGAVSASRTFDITVTLKAGMGQHQFSNINRYANPIDV